VAEADRARWNIKYKHRGDGPLSAPSSFLLALDDVLPTRGRALDLAGGSGRHALWLAERGLEVTLADVSDEALQRARDVAKQRGLPLTTERVDLEENSVAAALGSTAWDVIVLFNYLWRPLFAQLPGLLANGGLFAFCQPTRTNLQRNAHPGARFLLDDGELPSLVEGLRTLRYTEGWSESGRHEARLLATLELDSLDGLDPAVGA
jgi:tellurite methyltransferase